VVVRALRSFSRNGQCATWTWFRARRTAAQKVSRSRDSVISTRASGVVATERCFLRVIFFRTRIRAQPAGKSTATPIRLKRLSRLIYRSLWSTGVRAAHAKICLSRGFTRLYPRTLRGHLSIIPTYARVAYVPACRLALLLLSR